ncbi:MAG: hypothetical protein QXX36_03690 [Candidatus Rehaiarchaeum fermentans]|nr:hypothetical protein [Candidatus Rehaiarchaeum fermentans]
MYRVNKKELVVLLIIPLIFTYEVFLDPFPYPLFYDLLSLLFLILFFKKIRLFESDEKEIIFSFLNDKLSFMKTLMKLLF